MKVVITGGAGFIGANLAQAMASAGASEVVAFDDLSTGSEPNLANTHVSLVPGSILDVAALESVFAGADVIVHLAARPSVPKSIAAPLATHDVNATGTARVLEAARRAGAPYLVVASSSSVYGRNPALPKHEQLPPMPASPYAASKLATEAYALAWGASFGLDVVVFRFFNVYGPLQSAGHDYAAVVPSFISAALSGGPLPVHGDGTQTRDFTFVGDVAAVLCEAIRRRITSELPVNLAFGRRHSLLDVISLLEEVMGRRLERTHLSPRAGDVRDSQADQTRLHDLFPDIEPVELREGLRRTYEWFASRRRSTA